MPKFAVLVYGFLLLGFVVFYRPTLLKKCFYT